MPFDFTKTFIYKFNVCFEVWYEEMAISQYLFMYFCKACKVISKSVPFSLVNDESWSWTSKLSQIF